MTVDTFIKPPVCTLINDPKIVPKQLIEQKLQS